MRDGRRTSWPPVLALAALSVLLPPAARLLAGPPGALIHVRWQANVDDEARRTFEERFSLTDGERLDDRTWRYDLIDPSRDAIRSIVTAPAVADTHQIERPRFALAPGAARTGRQVRLGDLGDAVVAVADATAVAAAVWAAALVLLHLSLRIPALYTLRIRAAGAARAAARAGRAAAARARRAADAAGDRAAPLLARLQRGVPEIDARTAALFRIVFGAVTLAFFLYPTQHVDRSWLAATFDPEVEGPVHAWVLDWLGQRPILIDLITPWLAVFGVAFVVGAFTRVTYALFVAGVLAWAYVAMSVESTHPHSTLVLTLVALLPSRWGDALSLDSRRRGPAAGAGAASRRYGYTVWVPMLTFGVGFAAAAWAKLTVPPDVTSWVLNGTIKYHIISDLAAAPVDWGLQLVHYPSLAVIASFGAIAVEALVVTAVFSRSEGWRLAMGASAAALFAGIALLMGIVWPGWWIPLLAFLPWQRWARALPDAAPPPGARPARRLLTAAQMAVAVAVVAQQVVVSALRLERAPMFSWYDMYSRSYADAADFNASIPPAFRVVLAGQGRTTQLRCSPHEEFVREFQSALAGAAESRVRILRAIRGCGADPSTAEYVTLEGTARTFDWDRLEFAATHPISLGPLPTRQDEDALPAGYRE